MTDSDWLVIVSNVRCERRAAQALRDKGFEVWCPMRVIEFRVGPARNRCRACRLIPALPGYLLARGRSWHDTHGVDGVRGVLAVDARPLKPTAAEMTWMRRQFDLAPAPMVDDAYRIGDRVHVTLSPTTELDGIMAGWARNGRLTVLANFLGREVPIEVDHRVVSQFEFGRS